MGFRLFLLFVIVPLLELLMLVRLGEHIGLWNTILIILATGLLGSTLARYQGLGVWRRLQLRLAEGQVPGTELIDGIIILVCGALLITPGVLTDVVGLLGLLPPTRAMVRGAIRKWLERRIAVGGSSTPFRFGPYGQSMPGGHARGQPSQGRGEVSKDISDVVENYRRTS